MAQAVEPEQVAQVAQTQQLLNHPTAAPATTVASGKLRHKALAPSPAPPDQAPLGPVPPDQAVLTQAVLRATGRHDLPLVPNVVPLESILPAEPPMTCCTKSAVKVPMPIW